MDIHWLDPYSLQTNLSVDHDFGHGFGLRVSYVGLHLPGISSGSRSSIELPLSTTTAAIAQPRTAFNYPNFYSIAERSTSAQADYHSGQAELTHRFSQGLCFLHCLHLRQEPFRRPGNPRRFFAAPPASSTSRAATTPPPPRTAISITATSPALAVSAGSPHSVYELPAGRGKRFLGKTNRATDILVGGWQVSGIFVLQTGPFLTAYLPAGGADPSGTGSGSLVSRQQSAQTASPTATLASHTRAQWFNSAAFACPGGRGANNTTGFASLQSAPGTSNSNCIVGSNNPDPLTGQVQAPIGRFGTESVGDLVGPRSVTFSSGLSAKRSTLPSVSTSELKAPSPTSLTTPTWPTRTSTSPPPTSARSPRPAAPTSAATAPASVSVKLEF